MMATLDIRDRVKRTVRSWNPSVLLVNPVKGAPGTRGTEAAVAKYAETVAPSYLYGGFQKTFPSEPLYFQTMAAELRRHRISCEVVDGYCHRLDLKDLLQVIKLFQSRIVAFAAFHNTVHDAIRCAAEIKRRDPSVVTVFGSAYASPHWKEILDHPEVDYVVVGDGEVAFRELAEHVLSGMDSSHVAGIANCRHGVPTLTPPVPIVDLDALAFPSRDLAPIVADDGHSLSMYTSRGCAFGKCSFCYLLPYQEISLQPLWRARSPENVVNELEYLVSEYAVERVTFVDEDYFGTNGPGVNRALEIARLIIERNIRVNYYVNALVKSLQFVTCQGHLPLLVKSGLDSVFTGFESTSREVLVSYRKPQRPEHYNELIDALTTHNIHINPGLITFSRNSTLAEVVGNVELAQTMKYYDLFLFTRRLVDLGASSIDTRSDSMAASETNAGWLEIYRRNHDAEAQNFSDLRVASLYQLMRMLCNLLFEAYQKIGSENVAHLRSTRDTLIRAHFLAFYSARDLVCTENRYLSFEESFSWAQRMTTWIVNRAEPRQDCEAEQEWLTSEIW